jgi:transposase
VSKKRVARELGLDVKTVRKWWRRAWSVPRRKGRGKLLAPWEAFLKARAPEVGFNASVLHRELVDQGVEVSYWAVAKYVAPWRAEWRPEEVPTVRYETEPGEQAQVDWGTTWAYFGEERVRVHVFTMVLGYSRRIFARAYRSEGLGSLLDGHARAFEHFGGRTGSILYDNPRTVVLSKDEAAGQVVWNPTFKDRMDFYGVDVRLCRFYRAQTKGKVESGVKYIKRNALVGRRFRDLDELNDWLLAWCLRVADQRVHGTTHERPVERFERDERQVLVAVDARPPAVRERVETRVVPRDALVAVEANRYPVPFDWCGRQVEVRVLPEEIVLALDDGEPVRHRRLAGKHQVARWEGPPRPWPRSGPAPAPLGPPRFDPAFLGGVGQVEVRSLVPYAAVAGEVLR